MQRARFGYTFRMPPTEATAPWHDPSWRVSSDNPLQAGLRLQQAWWRQACRGVREAGVLHPPPKPGKPSRSHNPLVVSMLPASTVGFAPNLMWPQALDAYEVAKEALNAGAGIIYEDRLRRNLLSSQPLCFNLFGYLGQVDANAFLPWVRTYSPRATSVSRIKLEYSPSVAEMGVPPLGGCSAFDAFVEYTLPGESKGFIGIETKYHEDLAKGLKIPPEGSPARDKYVRETQTSGSWVRESVGSVAGCRFSTPESVRLQGVRRWRSSGRELCGRRNLMLPTSTRVGNSTSLRRSCRSCFRR